MITSAIIFVLSFALVLGVTPSIIAWANKANHLDQPDSYRKAHHAAVPRLGGIPLFLVFFSICIFAIFMRPEEAWQWGIILFCNTLLFAVGLWDDFKPLGAKVKLIAQISIAFLAYFLGLKISQISYPLGDYSISLGAWSVILTVLWLISVPNLINLIDGIDGLATGLGFFLFISIGFAAQDQADVTWVSFAMAGALLGFLRYNFPPAKIFLGDAGAYLIGFAVATISLKSANKGAVMATLFVTVLALGLPIMDTAFAILRRALRGFPLFKADADHIHHRLQHLGFSKRRVVLGMYLVSVVLSCIGLNVLWTQGRSLPVAIALVFVMIIVGVLSLGYFWSWDDLKEQLNRTIIRRPEVQYTVLQAKVMELEVERCQNFAEFEACLAIALQRVGFELHLHPETKITRPLTLTFKNDQSLRLYAPSRESLRHWQRLAECFREPYAKALQKWPSAAER